MKRMQFIKKDGNKEITCEVVATYHDDNTNKDYIIYYESDDKNKVNLYYSLYTIEDNKIVLIPTNNIEEKEIGLELIKEILNDIKNT